MIEDDLPVIIRNFYQVIKSIKMNDKYNGENIEKYIFFLMLWDIQRWELINYFLRFMQILDNI